MRTTETMTRRVFDAIEAGQPVYTREGSLCRVMKLKNGRAKVMRVEKGRLQQAWVEVMTLRTKN